jgi:predicted permease
MILIAIAVVASMLIGAEARRRDERVDRLVHLDLDFVLWVLVPIIGFAFASRVTFNVSTVLGILCGYLVIATVGLIAWRVARGPLHLSRRSQGAMVLSVILANTGYFGLPVSAALLGHHQLPGAVLWDQLISAPMAFLIAPFIAAAFAGRSEGSVLRHLPQVLKRAPAIPALILGLLAPKGWVPDWLLHFATYCVYATLPLGFFAVGATIVRLRDNSSVVPSRVTATTLALRILMAPALYAVLYFTVLPREPHAFLLQAAMPSGINALVIGHAFELDRGLIATSIAWSTSIVLVFALVGGLAF